MVLESVIDDRNSKMKQLKDGVVDDVKIAIAAMKKLNDIVALSSAETPATIAERERVDQIRYRRWTFTNPFLAFGFAMHSQASLNPQEPFEKFHSWVHLYHSQLG